MIARYCRREDCEVDRAHPEHEEDFPSDAESFGEPIKVKSENPVISPTERANARLAPFRRWLMISNASKARPNREYAYVYWRAGGKLPLGKIPKSCCQGHRLLPGSDRCIAGHTRRTTQRQL